MIVSIWIDWAATDEAAVLRNTREAMRTALLRAVGREAYAGDFLDDALDAFTIPRSPCRSDLSGAASITQGRI
jgi:formaldehyde-activating enzyme involved in methanogenesis